MASLLPTPIPPDPVEGELGHFDHTNWVKASLLALDAGTVHSADANVGGALSAEEITIDKPNSQEATLFLQGNGPNSVRSKTAAGSMRWRMDLGDGTAEGGSNSGSRFKLLAYGDDGNLRHTVLDAERNTGLVSVKGDPTAALGVATKQYVDAAMPIGAIIAYGGSTAPAGWHLCNGTAHGSAALQALIGSADTPDLSGRFIVGAGTGYNPKATGGVASNTLTPAQTATKGHGHSASSTEETAEHKHIVNPPLTWSSDWNQSHQHWISVGGGSHGHEMAYANNWQGSAMDQNPPGSDYSPIGQSNANFGKTAGPGSHGHSAWSDPANQGHQHYVDIGEFWSGGRSAPHTHVISIGATSDANATASIENRPPYYALVYIIKKA